MQVDSRSFSVVVVDGVAESNLSQWELPVFTLTLHSHFLVLTC